MTKKTKKNKCQIKKDYQRKNLENPFFRYHNKAGKKKKCFNWKYYLLIISIIISLIIYGIFLSPIFSIKNIRVSGLGRLPETAITQILWQQTQQKIVGPFTQENIWLFNKDTARNELLKSFNFSQIKINKKMFNSIVVEIEERPYAFIWQERGQSYYSDSNGFIIKDSSVEEKDLTKFPIIENRTPNSLVKGVILDIDPDYLSSIFTIKREVELCHELVVDRYIIDQEFKTVKVLFSNSLLTFFNINDDIKKQVEKLIVVKNEKEDLSEISYVDLRYGDKVFIGNK